MTTQVFRSIWPSGRGGAGLVTIVEALWVFVMRTTNAPHGIWRRHQHLIVACFPIHLWTLRRTSEAEHFFADLNNDTRITLVPRSTRIRFDPSELTPEASRFQNFGGLAISGVVFLNSHYFTKYCIILSQLRECYFYQPLARFSHFDIISIIF